MSLMGRCGWIFYLPAVQRGCVSGYPQRQGFASLAIMMPRDLFIRQNDSSTAACSEMEQWKKLLMHLPRCVILFRMTEERAGGLFRQLTLAMPLVSTISPGSLPQDCMSHDNHSDLSLWIES